MIALKNYLPLLRNRQGNAFTLEQWWLRVVIHEAARRAGHDWWWQADDLAAAISTFLQTSYARGVIDFPELDSIVRAALRDVGFDDVAAHFYTEPASLRECL